MQRNRSDCNVHNSLSRSDKCQQRLLAVKITHVTEKEIGEYPNEKTFDQLEDAFGQRERKHSSSNMSIVLEGNKRERKKKRNFLFL
jgi:hypothetical protein